MNLETVWILVQKVLGFSLSSAAIVLLFFKWAGNTWVGRFLNRDLERFRRQQQEELEAFKNEQQKEVERLRHLLSSRVSRIHEKEFEILPKAWLMLHDLRGAVTRAVGLPLTRCPAFERFSQSELEEFLKNEVAVGRLSELQIGHLRTIGAANDQLNYYMDAMMAGNIDEAEEKRRLFVNHLIENRIFMNDELRQKFSTVQEALISALTSYDIGKSAKNWEMMRSAQKTMADTKMQDLVDEVDGAIQKRLRYAEAD